MGFDDDKSDKHGVNFSNLLPIWAKYICLSQKVVYNLYISSLDADFAHGFSL